MVKQVIRNYAFHAPDFVIRSSLPRELKSSNRAKDIQFIYAPKGRCQLWKCKPAKGDKQEKQDSSLRVFYIWDHSKCESLPCCSDAGAFAAGIDSAEVVLFDVWVMCSMLKLQFVTTSLNYENFTAGDMQQYRISSSFSNRNACLDECK